jgi:hypothetical protein
MKLNKKKLNGVLPQIKAHLNVAVMMDNPERPGVVDFLFQPKAREIEHGHLNKLTCGMGGGNDLFADTAIETLGKPLVVDISRLRDALKGGGFEPELKDGAVNGINILADANNLKMIRMGKIIDANWNGIKDFNFSGGFKFTMPRVDYELMANTMSQFVSQDATRIFMCGYAIDFGKGEDFINFAATDGRKLAVCKFPCRHPKMEGNEGEGGGFIFNPLHLFIPESDYSRTQWRVNECFSLVRIQTEDYSIDCWAKPIEGRFPNYIRVIPDKERNKEWMNLNARSVRNAFDSIKGLVNNNKYSSSNSQVILDAEDPKRIKLTVPGASVDIDGEASRPMRLRVDWRLMAPAFFDAPFTKFSLQSVSHAILAEESRAARGTIMTVTKVVMPLSPESDVDEWGVAASSQSKTPNDESSAELDSKALEDEKDSSIEYGDSAEGDD